MYGRSTGGGGVAVRGEGGGGGGNADVAGGCTATTGESGKMFVKVNPRGELAVGVEAPEPSLTSSKSLSPVTAPDAVPVPAPRSTATIPPSPLVVNTGVLRSGLTFIHRGTVLARPASAPALAPELARPVELSPFARPPFGESDDFLAPRRRVVPAATTQGDGVLTRGPDDGEWRRGEWRRGVEVVEAGEGPSPVRSSSSADESSPPALRPLARPLTRGSPARSSSRSRSSSAPVIVTATEPACPLA